MPTSVACYAPITVRPGESLAAVVFVLQQTDGTALDLTSCTARWTARTSPDATGALFDLHSSDGGLVIDAAAGTIAPVVAAATTADWTAALYQHELYVTFADGERRCTHRGTIRVVASATRYPDA